MRKDDKVRDIFSSKFENFEPSVPSDMWNKIEQGLPIQPLPASSRKKPLYRYMLAVAGIAAVFVVCFILFFSENYNQRKVSDVASPIEGNTATISNNAEQTKQPIEFICDTLANTNSFSVQSIHNTYAFTNNANSQTLTINGDKNGTDTQTLLSGNNPPSIIVENYEDKNQSTNNIQKNVDEKTLKQQLEELEALGQNHQVLLLADNLEEKKSKSKGFTLSFNGGSGLASENNDNIIVENPLSKMVVRGGESLNSYSNGVVRKEAAVDMDHRQPISFGLTISKNITNNLSIETGVVYTYLSSKIRGEKPQKYQRADNQYFHYLGVPLTVNYTFAKWGRADFYISAGGMIQKDIAGRMKGSSKVQDEFTEKEGEFNEKISQDHLQLSVNGAVGASYPIYKNLHVYTTVGGVYYFDANNEYKTIYSDKKLQLDLNLGLKLKF